MDIETNDATPTLKGPRRNAAKEAFWRRLVDGQAASGQSVRQWCAANQVPEASFYQWRRELARRDGAQRSPGRSSARDSAPSFVELRASLAHGEASRGQHLRVTIGDASIEVPVGFCEVTLRRVVDTLRADDGHAVGRGSTEPRSC